MFLRTWFPAALILLATFSASAATRCERVLQAFGNQLADATCFESTDLTTNNPLTTPPDNSLPGLPLGAFTPQTDRNILINATATPPEDKTPITMAVPGLQISARIASDPGGEARFLLRLPDRWNGRLVVAGTPSQRSEFTSDYGWSDYVVQKGYAFASQNKGVLNAYLTTSADPLGCRLNPSSTTYVHFYDNDPAKPFTQWTKYMIDGAQLARIGVKGAYGAWPKFTYAVGTSNGGYQVRRAVEMAPKLFDGGVDWEGTYVDKHAPNILTDLPPGVLNYPDYLASGVTTNGTAARNIMGAGYPPDLLNGADSFWGHYYTSYWEVTMCQWQKRLDPGYDTYGSGLATYNYVGRLAFSEVGNQMADFATTGLIQSPLITVAGTMDALLPIDHHARAYARAVAAAFKNHGPSGQIKKIPAYRLYEVQNGNHIENYKSFFPKHLEYILPHAQRAFDLLVAYVEQGKQLPPNQCIPRGGEIAAAPTEPGHCTNLLAQ